MKSIRRQLMVWLLGAVFLGGVIASVAAYLNTLGEMNEIFDYQLRQLALSAYRHASLATAADDEADSPDLEFLIQAWGENRVLLFRSHAGDGPPFSQVGGFSTVPTRTGELRVFTLVANGRVIQAAQPMEARRSMAASAALRILVPILASIPLLAALIWLSLRRGLAPIGEAVRAVGAKSAQSLTPLPLESLPEEMKSLTAAINDLMRRLGHALEAQRQFTADAAHELRSPLTALMLQAQLLEQAGTPEAHAAALAELRQGIKRASHLVQQLLALARLEPNAPRPAEEPVDLSALARSVVAEFAVQAEAKDIDLGAEANEPAIVLGHREELRTLLSNLVDNAVHYTPQGGRIDVVARRAGENAVLEVADTGPGIPADERGRVFDRFYRVAGGEVPGSGLGLAIVQAIVRQHGGAVVLEDASPGGGLRVRVSLPRAAQDHP